LDENFANDGDYDYDYDYDLLFAICYLQGNSSLTGGSPAVG